MSQLYLVKANDYTWDDYIGFVVRADSPERAREIASDSAGFGNQADFTDPTRSTIEEIATEGPEGVILDSFHAG